MAFSLASAIPSAAGAAPQATSKPEPPANTIRPIAAPSGPAGVLAEILAAACRQDTGKFPDFLTSTNAAYFRQLTPSQQVALLRRLVLLQQPGRGLFSTDAAGRTVLRCETPSFIGEIHFGAPRVDQNLAFVPVEIKPDRQIDFGLVQTSGGWKLLSLGVLMLDLQQLQPSWDAQELADHEDGVIAALRKIAAALDTYRNAFEKLPESLAQLGPAPKEGISPDAAGLLDADMLTGKTSGYTIRYRILPAGENGKDTQYELAATPNEYTKSGRRSFFLNASGRLRGADKMGAPATAADPVIEEPSSDH